MVERLLEPMIVTTRADRRILEFAVEDLWDDEVNGDPVRESTYPAFASYADLLDHVIAVKLPDGTIIHAQD